MSTWICLKYLMWIIPKKQKLIQRRFCVCSSVFWGGRPWWVMLLLANIFESFRDTCIEHYELDPAHNYTNPGLTRNAALKLTGAELDLFADMDMNLLIEEKIRGGVNFISHRFWKANVLEPKWYDKSKPNKCLIYLNVDYLYGWAMSQALPTAYSMRMEYAHEFDVSAVCLNSCILYR